MIRYPKIRAEAHSTTTDVLQDTLGDETGRELDSYSYRIETDGEEIDIWFQHRDLVPATQ